MNFQEFCQRAEENESKRSEQQVSTSNTFVISFSAVGGKAFSVDPKDIVTFLEFLRGCFKTA